MTPRWDDLRPLFKQMRDERGLDSLAVALGTSRSSVDRWARGIVIPMGFYQQRIAAWLLVEHQRQSHLGQGGQPRDPRVQ